MTSSESSKMKNAFGTMMDTMDFMRKAWGGLPQMPGSLQPTIDVNEIDKRIADLKAVEQWLQMNLGMLRGTIQGLEVQRATITTISSLGKTVFPEPMNKAVGQAISQSVEKAAKVVDRTKRAKATASSMMQSANAAASWWDGLQKQFNSVTSAALAGGLAEPKKAKAPVKGKPTSKAKATKKK